MSFNHLEKEVTQVQAFYANAAFRETFRIKFF